MLIFFITAIGASASDAAGPIRVAVVPFNINAEKDLTFLKDGIFDMLAFRLSTEGKVEVIGREDTEKVVGTFIGTLDETKARDIGSRLGADYVLFGSLTVFGNSVSINAKMTDVAGKKPSLGFFDQTRGTDEVIPKITLFAMAVNDRFATDAKNAGQKTAAPDETVRASEPVQPAAVPARPKKIAEEEAPNPAFIMEQRRKASQEVWKSQVFEHLINGMALGDVDGDGKTETVLTTPCEVHIYRAENGRFDKIKEIRERHKNFIGTDVGDINGNGYPEIFITSLNAQRSRLRSFVLEWNGGDYVRIVEESPWYYRVIGLSGQGSLLLGQKNTSDNPFSGKIFEMTWQNSGYVPGKQAISSKRNNLMGLTIGNVMNTGKKIAVAYGKSDHIRLIDPTGGVMWKGGEKYGGSMLYYLMPKVERGTENRQYLPMRLIVGDIDDDGKNEVIVARNHDIVDKFLKTFRKFTKTHIESLFWDGIGLAVNWKTYEIAGHISDFAVGDFDNDGMNELIATVILKDGDIIGTSPQSVVIAYDLK